MLTDLARELLDRNTFVVLSTLNPDGSPQLTEEQTWQIVRYLEALASKRIER